MTTLEHEIRAALLPGAPTEEQVDTWVQDALERPAPRAARLHPLWLLAAAAAVAAAVLLRPPADPPRAPRAAGTVEEERAINRRALEADPPGDAAFAVVAGGEVKAGPKLADLLAWADRAHPRARHRFVIRLENGKVPGDVVADRSPVAENSAGLFFLDPAGIEVRDGWARRGAVRAKADDLLAHVNDRHVTVRLDGESLAPLLLPADVRFPRFEAPGRLILEDMDRSWRQYRRYLVRIRIAALGVDGFFEAAGAEQTGPHAPGNWVAVRLGSYVWRPLRDEPASKPRLVLRYRAEDVEALNRLFDGAALDRFELKAVPGATRTRLERRQRDGTIAATIDLPASRADLDAFLSR